MIDKNNKTFCIFPWIHQHVSTSGDVLPCCIAHHEHPMGNVKNKTISEIWNDEQYRTLRLNMLNGIKSEHCRVCYSHEESFPDVQNNSFRTGALREFKEFLNIVDTTNEDGSLPEVSLKYFDVRWSNICNFKCRSCGDGFSSSWAQETKANSTEYKFPVLVEATENNEKLLEQFKPHLLNMKIIYFAGGEPLITKEHYQILEYLIDNNATSTRLRYNSNMSNLNYKNKNIIEYWKHFERVEINASIDSWGKRAEYIRHGTDWNLIVENLNKIITECPHIELTFSSVIGLWGCLTITDFLEELEKHQFIEPSTAIVSLYRQLHPQWQNLKVLPLELRMLGIKKIDDYIDKKNLTYGLLLDNLKMLKEFMMQPHDTSFDNIIKTEIDRIDKIRGESFLNTFPELESFYHSLPGTDNVR